MTVGCNFCTRALQQAVTEQYEESCVGCGVRKLAYMPAEERERQLDRLQHVCGWDARAEVARMVKEEMARIAALKRAPSRARKVRT